MTLQPFTVRQEPALNIQDFYFCMLRVTKIRLKVLSSEICLVRITPEDVAWVKASCSKRLTGRSRVPIIGHLWTERAAVGPHIYRKPYFSQTQWRTYSINGVPCVSCKKVLKSSDPPSHPKAPFCATPPTVTSLRLSARLQLHLIDWVTQRTSGISWLSLQPCRHNTQLAQRASVQTKDHCTDARTAGLCKCQ